jgi:O-antigen biosynthesis protein WbqP
VGKGFHFSGNTIIGLVMKRILDLLLAVPAAIMILVLAGFVALSVRLTSKGPIIYWSERVGRDNNLFKMPKFRTMKVGAPVVATHLLTDTDKLLTPIGSFLRRSSLDELPQLWSIILGDMSFVGPRPALFNQKDLIDLRIKKDVHKLIPGLTGWAQVNGRDELPIPLKVKLDMEYMERRSISFDLYILWLTIVKVVRREGVSH